jgi:hypothetical protein
VSLSVKFDFKDKVVFFSSDKEGASGLSVSNTVENVV